MTNKKQEQLKKMLATGDFREESYAGFNMQELIILKNSAASMKVKNIKVKQNADFFAKREEFFQFLVMRRLQKLENLYVIFAHATNLPYVVCDPDTCNDQVWLFSEELLAKNMAAKEQKESGRKFAVAKLETKQFLAFYMSLYPMGINELVIDRGANTLAFPLEALVRRPDYSKVPPEKQPVLNPELMLTAIYFAQDRALPAESVDKENLRELEEEMLVNLQRGKVLMPVQVPEGTDEKVQIKDMKFPILKLQNGDSYQPVCTDPNELQKFNQGKGFRAVTVEGAKLKGLVNKDCKGILLNPLSVRLAIPREKLD